MESPSIAPAALTTPATIVVDDASLECSHIIDVGITTDSNPNETAWEIVGAATDQYVTGFRSPKNTEEKPSTKTLQSYTEYHWKICASFSATETSFVFRIHDTGMDGLQPPGKYSLSMDEELIASGGPFPGGYETIEFSTTQPGLDET